jgi:ribosome-binding ATPase YchF (GTP1/OBG family)
MEDLINLFVFLISGVLGVGIMRFFRKREVKAENDKVVKKVNDINLKNEEMTKQILDNLTKAANRLAELEKQKNEQPKTDQELVDWFANRKPDKHQ